ncbi:hypothetical protein AVEN_140215-1 [Araneus ventricosus]|uniref:Uncharacterized protein n=1 Tax=Araneus ventricosus TaxID=182803 RepID=A0A4Y2I7X5_ARAVE|nr:hypothetical protein AVEN_140215-1 [Araneus ventricosus]
MEQREGSFSTDKVNLNLGQMTKPEMALPLLTSTLHQRKDVWTSTYDLACNRPTWAVFNGIEIRTYKTSGSKVENLPLGHLAWENSTQGYVVTF